MFEVQDKQIGQHAKQNWSIFRDQLSLLFREIKWAWYNNNNKLGQSTR